MKKVFAVLGIIMILTCFLAFPVFAWSEYSAPSVSLPADFYDFTYKLILHKIGNKGDFGYLIYLSNAPIKLFDQKVDPTSIIYNDTTIHIPSTAGFGSLIGNSITYSAYNTCYFDGKIYAYNNQVFHVFENGWFNLSSDFVLSSTNDYVYGSHLKDVFTLSSLNNQGLTTVYEMSGFWSSHDIYNFNISGVANSTPFFIQGDPLVIPSPVPSLQPSLIPTATPLYLVGCSVNLIVLPAVLRVLLVVLPVALVVLAVLLGVSLIPRVISSFKR